MEGLSIFVKGGRRGRERLVDVFWRGWIVLMALSLPLLLLPETWSPPIPVLVGMTLLLLFLLAALVWWCVAVWRCAANVEHRVWFYLARLVIVFTVVQGILVIVGVGL